MKTSFPLGSHSVLRTLALVGLIVGGVLLAHGGLRWMERAAARAAADKLDWPTFSEMKFVSLETGQDLGRRLQTIEDPAVAILVWASWCEYCKVLMNRVADLQALGLLQSIRFVLVSVDGIREDGVQAARELSIKGDWVMPELAPEIWASNFRLPVLRVFDQSRELRCRFSGFNDEKMKTIEECFRLFRQAAQPKVEGDEI